MFSSKHLQIQNETKQNKIGQSFKFWSTKTKQNYTFSDFGDQNQNKIKAKSTKTRTKLAF